MTSDETVTIGDVFARNLRATRNRRGLSVRALSERLGALGYPVLPTGITRAEAADREKRRRVTVEELAALAVALDTSPAFLLAPIEGGEEQVAIVPAVSVGAWEVDDWTRGEAPLSAGLVHRPDDSLQDRERTYLDAAPASVQRLRRLRWRESIRSARELEHVIGDAFEPCDADAGESAADLAAHLRRVGQDVAQHVEIIVRGLDERARQSRLLDDEAGVDVIDARSHEAVGERFGGDEAGHYPADVELVDEAGE